MCLVLSLQKFQDDLVNQEDKLRECLHLGQEILKRAHPDAITTVKHWLTILQARWEEVKAWTDQREQKLNDALSLLRANEDLLQELMKWLQDTEDRLVDQDSRELPENVPILEQLLHDHMVRMHKDFGLPGLCD